MTIVEVVVALAILLFGLTAMLTLMLTSTGLTAKARAEGLAVNKANQFIEQVRAQKYSDLSQGKLNLLAAAASGTVGGMTTVVTATMTPYYEASQPASATPAYRSVKVVVVVSGPGFKSYRFATGTHVREWRWSGGSSSTETRTAPTVEFDSSTPAAGATARPIWGTVHVGATAVANMTDVVLTQLYVKWGTSYLATSTPLGASGSASSSWDTSVLNAEGRRVTLFAEVWDALNQSDTKSRDFIIDNVKPPAPGTVSLSSTTANTAATWTWPAVMDGESLVPDYVASLHKVGTTGSSSATVVSPSATFVTSPFSLYYVSVLARGPRAAAGVSTDWVSPETAGPYLLTRPGFTSMSIAVNENAFNKPFAFTTSSMTLTPPSFSVSSPAKPYRWEYRIGSGSWTAFGTSTTNPTSGNSVTFPRVTMASNGTQTSLSVRCTATVAISGVDTVIKSPIMVRTDSLNKNSTYTLADFTPDWTTSW